jgi:hypothetical protein
MRASPSGSITGPMSFSTAPAIRRVDHRQDHRHQPAQRGAHHDEAPIPALQQALTSATYCIGI